MTYQSTNTVTTDATYNAEWKSDPATTKQLDYLESLLNSRDPHDLTHAMVKVQFIAGGMTKGDASKAISAMHSVKMAPGTVKLSDAIKMVMKSAEVTAHNLSEAGDAAKGVTKTMNGVTAAVKSLIPVEVGIYDLKPELGAPTSIPSGRWIIVYQGKHGLRTKRLYKSYSTKSGFSWKQSHAFHFTGIKQGHYPKVPIEDIAKLGQTVGFCFYCGSFLSDPESKSKGYGPICAKHYGLPWGK